MCAFKFFVLLVSFALIAEEMSDAIGNELYWDYEATLPKTKCEMCA